MLSRRVVVSRSSSHSRECQRDDVDVYVEKGDLDDLGGQPPAKKQKRTTIERTSTRQRGLFQRQLSRGKALPGRDAVGALRVAAEWVHNVGATDGRGGQDRVLKTKHDLTSYLRSKDRADDVENELSESESVMSVRVASANASLRDLQAGAVPTYAMSDAVSITTDIDENTLDVIDDEVDGADDTH